MVGALHFDAPCRLRHLLASDRAELIVEQIQVEAKSGCHVQWVDHQPVAESTDVLVSTTSFAFMDSVSNPEMTQAAKG